MVAGLLEIGAYIVVLLLCVIAFVQVSRGYKVSKERLGTYDIIDLAKIFMLTFGFIIIKLTLDYVAVLGFMSQAIYTYVGLGTTIVILFGILYSVKVLLDISRSAQ